MGILAEGGGKGNGKEVNQRRRVSLLWCRLGAVVDGIWLVPRALADLRDEVGGVSISPSDCTGPSFQQNGLRSRLFKQQWLAGDGGPLLASGAIGSVLDDDFDAVGHSTATGGINSHPDGRASVYDSGGGALPCLLSNLLVAVLKVEEGCNKGNEEGEESKKFD